jgi:hypothetical protein
MTRSDANFSARSQKSTPPVPDLVTVDRQTLKNVLRLLSGCVDDVQIANHTEIMLYALDNYLSEEKDVNVNKAMLLLRYWLDVTPERLKEVLGDLEEAHDLIKVILEATK